MTRRRFVWLILSLVIVAAVAGWRFMPGHAPAGQPPLSTLDTASLETLRADFNRDIDRTRLIVLLSPT